MTVKSGEAREVKIQRADKVNCIFGYLLHLLGLNRLNDGYSPSFSAGRKIKTWY